MKTLVMFSLVFASLWTEAQDVITFRNGTLQYAKVLEVGKNNVVYKRTDNMNGPNYLVDKNQILMIEYANGSHDVMPYVKPNNYNTITSYSSYYGVPVAAYVRPQVNIMMPPMYYGRGGWGGYYQPYGYGGYYGGHHHGGHHRW
jgi:hypothetical protein